MNISIVRIIWYWDLAATEVLSEDGLKNSDSNYSVGVLLAKD